MESSATARDYDYQSITGVIARNRDQIERDSARFDRDWERLRDGNQDFYGINLVMV